MKSEDRNILPPPLHPKNQWIPIGTGNYYKGEWNHRTMSGKGVYVMLNGKFFLDMMLWPKIKIYFVQKCSLFFSHSKNVSFFKYNNRILVL